jgi:hypothetical protein
MPASKLHPNHHTPQWCPGQPAAKAGLFKAIYVTAEAVTHKDFHAEPIPEAISDPKVSQIESFVGRGFSRDVRLERKLGFSP